MRSPVPAAAYALLLCVALVGCNLWRPGVDISFDDPLEAKLSDLKRSGQSAQLSDLTNFSWDEVHVFHEGASREEIEKTVGSPVIKDEYWGSASNLLVFEDNGKVVKVISISGGYLRADKPTWPSDVRLEPWGNGAVRLTPGGESAGR
jgi:hypothetical protein